MKSDNRPRHYRKDTLLTHVGRNPEANHGVVNPPVIAGLAQGLDKLRAVAAAA
jgi:hypothetical protein